MEQNINYQDMDDIDYYSLHCFFFDNDRVIAYLRVFEDENNSEVIRIGRVLTLKHGKGIGKDLFHQSLNVIKSKRKYKKIVMHAQKHAVGFYEKFGFKIKSDEFLEEGIIHLVMELEI